MMNFLLIAMVLMAAGFGYALFAAKRAPVGYEDEQGFHYGLDSSEPAGEHEVHNALPAFSR